MTARLSPEPWLTRLAEALPDAASGDDADAVHRLRVATGRLITWLDLDGRRALQDDLRWLRDAAGAVRDRDVLLLTSIPIGLRSRLRRERRQARDTLALVAGSERVAALLRALALSGAVPLPRARRALSALAPRAVRRGAPLAAAAGRPVSAADIVAIHAARRALRRVRYALDWLGRPSSRVAACQEALGALNDASVALDLADGLRGADAWRSAKAARLPSLATEAIDAWIALVPHLKEL